VFVFVFVFVFLRVGGKSVVVRVWLAGGETKDLLSSPVCRSLARFSILYIQYPSIRPSIRGSTTRAS
jgi:hypothetical protein